MMRRRIVKGRGRRRPPPFTCPQCRGGVPRDSQFFGCLICPGCDTQFVVPAGKSDVALRDRLRRVGTELSRYGLDVEARLNLETLPGYEALLTSIYALRDRYANAVRKALLAVRRKYRKKLGIRTRPGKTPTKPK